MIAIGWSFGCIYWQISLAIVEENDWKPLALWSVPFHCFLILVNIVIYLITK